MGHKCFMELAVLRRDRNILVIAEWCLHNIVNLLHATELFTLKRSILHYVNFTLITKRKRNASVYACRGQDGDAPPGGLVAGSASARRRPSQYGARRIWRAKLRWSNHNRTVREEASQEEDGKASGKPHLWTPPPQPGQAAPPRLKSDS